jgi:hypothetical protein
MPETIPDQTSNAGTESRSRDWYEWLDEAEELVKQAKILPDMRRHPHAERMRKIDAAIEALQSARELCQ